MGEVAVNMKIFVDNPENIEKVKGEINKIVEIKDSREEDIGFGIKVLRIVFIMDDSGGVDKIEEKINHLEHVNQVEVESVGRI